MVFSSFEFLFIFLPITVILYYLLRKVGFVKYCIPFLFVASLCFYAYWKPIYLSIIISSMVINYSIVQWMIKHEYHRKGIFVLGLVFNIGLLAYFKYTDFFIDTVNSIVGTNMDLFHIILPIGISFYTFQQIAYIADVYTKKHTTVHESFIQYGLFISFFPQLIAGPIVHHREMMPQFAIPENTVVHWKNMYTGLCFLSMGLAKKVLIADSLAPMVGHVFDIAVSLTFTEALFGALAYTIQLYMDFSGYADMAIGCALFFNIQLPFNFNSPYKSTDIQDFWRRWHMTLSRWLRDYLYIPLGGNRQGEGRTLCNLFLTFLIGGLWHGAGWTFILWGSLHGGALVLHRLWSRTWNKHMPVLLGWVMTFIFVMLAWIPFRAVNFERLQVFLDALTGQTGWGMDRAFRHAVNEVYPVGSFMHFGLVCVVMGLSLLLIFISKNSQEMVAHIERKAFFFVMLICFTMALFLLIMPSYRPEFIYFQF